MSWGEAIRLTTQLSGDPSSRVGAALAGWTHPVAREAVVLMDLYDLQHASKSKRRTRPYPRPWAAPTVRRWGTRGMPREELLAKLTAHREESRHG